MVPRERRARRSPRSRSGCGRIVVDEEPQALHAMARATRGLGHDVIVPEIGVAAVARAVRGGSPELAIASNRKLVDVAVAVLEGRPLEPWREPAA